MNNPHLKQTGKKSHTIHPIKCALLIQPAVQPSLKSWGSYSTKRPAHKCVPPHTLTVMPTTEHTQEMGLQSYYRQG